MFFRRLISFVRSLVPTWATNNSGFWCKPSSVFLTMLLLVAPGKFNTSTFSDFDNPQLLMLFNMESPIIITFLASSLINLYIGVLWWLYLLLLSVNWWLLLLLIFLFLNVLRGLIMNCDVKKHITAFFWKSCFSSSKICYKICLLNSQTLLLILSYWLHLNDFWFSWNTSLLTQSTTEAYF